ncbi:MAG: branched-chain amino acid ABC transporter permease [Candidimonas sp.]|nr:MAG: branched-chain amino acid ABC transporter permease [Candidimonas sp.]
MPSSALLISQTFNGLVSGSLLALASVGLTIILGTLGVLNLAHGALFMVGAYVAYVTLSTTGSYVLALIVTCVALLILGAVLERGLIRFFYQRPDEDQILLTFGIAFVVVETARLIFGGIAKVTPTPAWGRGVYDLGFMIYPKYRIIAFGLTMVVLLLLYLVLYKTRVGLIVRAGIEDDLIVNILGINVDKTFLAVFAIGTMSAGLAGMIQSPIVPATPDMGFRVLVDSFVVVVLGGLGSFGGAVFGGLLAGLIISITAAFNPGYSYVALFTAMAIVLIVRPQGLFGVAGRD